MAKVSRNNGVTSVILRVKLLDSASTTGAGKTGLTSASGGLVISTISDVEAAATAYSGSNIEGIATLGTFAAPTSGKVRFKEVDATNHPGVYEIQIADARYAVSNATSIIVTVQATGVVAVDAEIDLKAAVDTTTNLTNAPTAGDLTATMKTSVTTAATAATPTVTAGTVSDKTGYALTSGERTSITAAVWDALTSGMVTIGSVGALVVSIAQYIDTEVAAIKAKTDNLPADPADASDVAALIAALQAKLKRYVQLLARKDAAIATDAATELGEINENAGSGAGGYANTTDAQEGIRDRGDAAWGSAGSAPQVLLDTDVDTVTDQTHLILTAGAADDDVYNNQTVVLYDASNANAPSVRKITDYDQATKTITLDSAADFTVVAADAVKIFVTPPGTTAPTAAEVAAELLNTTNTNSNDPTKFGGQIRRTHARVGGTVQTQDRDVPNAPVVSMNEANSAALVTQTPTVTDSETTWTPT